MSNYIQLRNQIEKLQKEAEVLRKRERAETIANIKEAITAFELTAEDLGLTVTTRSHRNRRREKNISVAGVLSGTKYRGQLAKKTGSTSQHGHEARKNFGRKLAASVDKRSVVAPKYRDTSTGATWTGRGKQPKWLAASLKIGKKLEDFKI